MGAAAVPLAEAGIGAAASIFGASKQASAGNKAAQLNYRAQQEALAQARQEAEFERERYRQEQARLDQAWAAEQARRAPFRNAALGILGDFGFNVPEGAYQPARPEDWLPGEGSYGYRSPTPIEETGFGAIPRRTPTVRRTVNQYMGRG